MEKKINLLIDDTKKEIMEVLSKSNLPVSIASMIINELAMQLNQQNEFAVRAEREEYKGAVNASENGGV